MKYLSSLFTLLGIGQCTPKLEDRTGASFRRFLLCIVNEGYTFTFFHTFNLNNFTKNTIMLTLLGLQFFFPFVYLNNLYRDEQTKGIHTLLNT